MFCKCTYSYMPTFVAYSILKYSINDVLEHSLNYMFIFFSLQRRMCEVILTSSPFSSCNRLVDPTQYIDACVQDLCRCAQNATGFCLCSTFTEYSRQCAHAGGTPSNWRTDTLCRKSSYIVLLYFSICT